jgi:predicted CXXCH cytochrome family protein
MSKGDHLKMHPERSLLLLIVILILPGVTTSAAGVLPAVKKECGTCHSTGNPTKESAPLNKPVAELCLDCHGNRKAAGEHRVGIIPTMTVQKLPLWEEKIACVTCHDPHANPYGKMLRAPTKELCRNCHPY